MTQTHKYHYALAPLKVFSSGCTDIGRYALRCPVFRHGKAVRLLGTLLLFPNLLHGQVEIRHDRDACQLHLAAYALDIPMLIRYAPKGRLVTALEGGEGRAAARGIGAGSRTEPAAKQRP